MRILPVVQLYTKATLDLKSIGTTTCTLSVYYTVRGVNHRTSDLYMDAPVHESIEQRTELAFDRHQWRLHVAALAGEGEYDTQPTNTPEETKAAIDKLASDSILAYTDEGCDGNGAGGKWGKAGFGVWICQKSLGVVNADGETSTVSSAKRYSMRWVSITVAVGPQKNTGMSMNIPAPPYFADRR